MKLWEKGKETNKLIEDFTTGNDRELDMQLAIHDVTGTLAHVKMLNSIGLLTNNELSELEKELKNIRKLIIDGKFKISKDSEDVHSQVEFMLTQSLGDTGKKVHTARSRNDQILLDLKLFTRDKIQEVVNETVKLFNLLLELSEKHKSSIMPGYTHMQIAMPGSFGLWFAAYAESLVEDMELLFAAYSASNKNPLGSAAGYGSSFPVNRSLTTKLLGFSTMHVNVINAQLSRGKMEKTVAWALASVGSTLAKMAMDICLYSGQNFNFFKLPEEFTTGSSIMPHKKNPDIFELVRATGNKLQALPVEIAFVNTNLPSGYHRDFQLIKESFIPAFDNLLQIISITKTVIENITVNSTVVDSDLYKDIFSVEEVNMLVRKGVPFREAYKRVAEMIESGNYNPDKKNLNHTHEGSIGNLCNSIISEKMEKVLANFKFDEKDNAINILFS